MITKKSHEEYLNTLGQDSGYDLLWFEEFHPDWLKTEHDRMIAVWGKLGTLMRKYDPIMFKISIQEAEHARR